MHLQANQILSAYSLIQARVPDDLIEELPPRALPTNWKAYPPPGETAMIGDAWVRRGESAVLRVPSVLADTEYNYLLNPAHPRFSKIIFAEPTPFLFDRRLRK